MTAAELVKALEAKGVRLSAHGGRLRVDAPRGALSPEDRRLLEAYRDDILRLLGADVESVEMLNRFQGGLTHTRTPEARCAGCGAGLKPEEAPAGVCAGCAQAPTVGPTGPDPEAFHRLLSELEASGGRIPELFRCPRCGSVCRLQSTRWKGVLGLHCPGCDRPAGTVEALSAGHFLGLKLKKAASKPDPEALSRAMEKLKAELGDLTGYESDLTRAVLEAAGRDPRPWPFNELDPVEWAALLAWAEGAVGTAPKTEAGPEPEPANPGFRAKPDRCPACGGGRFYQPWTGPHAGLWFCVGCNPGLKPETEPAAFGAGREELRELANSIYVLARRHGFPELEIFPGRKIGPGPEAWKEALRRPLEAGYESGLWAIMFALEEAVSAESERAYADKVLALAERLGYPELEGDGRCPGPIRRIPAGGTAWAVAVMTMDPARRRYWLGRLKEACGVAGQGR